MGAYVYRITSKRVLCSDGQEANVAVYAYKPTWSDEKLNRQWHKESGCPAATRLAREGKLTGRAVIGHDKEPPAPGSNVIKLPKNWGTFTDDYVGSKGYPATYLDGVTSK